MNVRRLIYEILQPDDGHSMSSRLFDWLITALIMASVGTEKGQVRLLVRADALKKRMPCHNLAGAGF